MSMSLEFPVARSMPLGLDRQGAESFTSVAQSKTDTWSRAEWAIILGQALLLAVTVPAAILLGAYLP